MYQVTGISLGVLNCKYRGTLGAKRDQFTAIWNFFHISFIYFLHEQVLEELVLLIIKKRQKNLPLSSFTLGQGDRENRPWQRYSGIFLNSLCDFVQEAEDTDPEILPNKPLLLLEQYEINIYWPAHVWV